MKQFVSKWFDKWSRKAKIPRSSLIEALETVESTNNANLGSGLYKIRIARDGKGKIGGYRTLLIFKKDDIALFIHGFAKNEQDNLSAAELKAFKQQAKYILGFTDEQIQMAVNAGEFVKLEKDK
jgi:hypothetical protein